MTIGWMIPLTVAFVRLETPTTAASQDCLAASGNHDRPQMINSHRVIASAAPVVAMRFTTSSAVKRPGGKPIATSMNQKVPEAVIKAMMQPAQFVRQAASRSPRVSSENVVVMPHDGQP